MSIEQQRADFEAWAKTHYYLSELGLDFEDDEYVDMEVQGAFEAYQAGRDALQSQPTESFPCRIIEADFETGSVTLEMQGKYTVSAGQKYLCDAPLQSQDREDALRYRWLRDPCSGAEHIIFYSRGDYGKGLMSGEMLDEAIDHARRAEGEGK